MWIFLMAQLIVTSPGPRLTPAEAVRVLRASHSPQDLTDYRAAPAPELHLVVVISKPVAAPAVQPRIEHRQFNYGCPTGANPCYPQVQIVGDVHLVRDK